MHSFNVFQKSCISFSEQSGNPASVVCIWFIVSFSHVVVPFSLELIMRVSHVTCCLGCGRYHVANTHSYHNLMTSLF